MYSYSHLHSYIQIYILQYNHDWIQKKSQTTYANLLPFEENGAQFQVISDEDKKKTRNLHDSVQVIHRLCYKYLLVIGMSHIIF